ncbi:hypothetical protein GN956_G22742 [Arapaima gigas]
MSGRQSLTRRNLQRTTKVLAARDAATPLPAAPSTQPPPSNFRPQSLTCDQRGGAASQRYSLETWRGAALHLVETKPLWAETASVKPYKHEPASQLSSPGLTALEPTSPEETGVDKLREEENRMAADCGGGTARRGT